MKVHIMTVHAVEKCQLWKVTTESTDCDKVSEQETNHFKLRGIH